MRLAVVETIVEEHGVEPLLLRVRDVDHKGRLRTGQALNYQYQKNTGIIGKERE